MYPGDEAVADIFGHDLVLLQLFEENLLVEVEDVLHVGEEDVLLVDEARLGFELAALVAQGVVVQLDADLQVFDVRLLRLQQLGHDELFATGRFPLAVVLQPLLQCPAVQCPAVQCPAVLCPAVLSGMQGLR